MARGLLGKPRMKKLPWAAALLTAALLNTAVGQGPAIRVVNAASASPDNLVPGAMITIKGSNLANTTATAPDASTLFTVLAGVAVRINGTSVGLSYVSPTQVNGVIDVSTPVGPATLTLTSPTANVSANITIQRQSAPGIFASPGAGSREGAIQNAITFALGPFSVTTNGGPTYLALYASALDTSVAPTVTIGGVTAPVVFYGHLTCCAGLDLINVQVPSSLAGAGRMEVVVNSGGRISNVVETVILPNTGQGPFAPAAENTARNREIGAITYVQALGVALVLDERDDVIRVIDMKQRAVTRTIALPTGAQPFAIAVNDAGSQAVVAERGRAKVAVIDLARGVVITEIAVDFGPSAVAINGDMVLVANEDADSVSVMSLVLKQVLATVPVGRSPRSIAIDDASSLAYVVNQGAGTISVIDISKRAVVDTLQLGATARPQTVRLVPGANALAVTEPNIGMLDLIDLTSKAVFRTRAAVNDLTFQSTTAYFVTQSGTASAVPFSMTPAGITLGVPVAIGLDAGLRGAAIDTLDRLLLVSSESSGTISLIDLASNRVAGSINAVRSETEPAARDDRSDRDRAGNTPAITSVVPGQATAGTTVQLTVSGTNLAGASDVFFAGPGGVGRDAAFTVTSLDVDSTGGQTRLTVQIAPGAAKGDHLLRAFTPNGESVTVAGTGNVLNVI